MATARQSAEWGRFSCLLSLTANAHRDPRRSRPFRPRDFNPYARLEDSGSGGVDFEFWCNAVVREGKR